MPTRLQFALVPAAVLLVTISCFAWAQVTAPDESLELDTMVTGSLSWGEDDMGLSVTIALRNRAGADAANIVINPILFSSADASTRASEILNTQCPEKITADMEANGLRVPRGGTGQIRFRSNMDVEELEPEADAAPVLLVCASYKLADRSETHKSAVLYRVLHADPVQGIRPVNRVTGDVPVQALKLEELGRHAG